MKVKKKLLLVIACVAAIAPGVTLPMSQPQRVEPVAAYSFAEITGFAEHAAAQAIGGARLDGGWFADRGGLSDSRETLVPVAAGRETHFVQDVARHGSGQEPDEPAGWMVLLSGLAVVAGIARRRASLAMM